jgi:hypothetical protein
MDPILLFALHVLSYVISASISGNTGGKQKKKEV